MPNRLQFEQSPYLLQHRENPVDWRPGGSEAFQTAREEDKPAVGEFIELCRVELVRGQKAN